MSRNPETCPHNITDEDDLTAEEYCVDCGAVIEPGVIEIDEEDL